MKTIFDIAIMQHEKLCQTERELVRELDLIRAAIFIDKNRLSLVLYKNLPDDLPSIESIISDKFGVSLKDARTLLIHKIEQFSEEDFS